MDYLSIIKQPIENDLNDFIALFNNSLTHDDGMLGSALSHIRQRGGKRMRPILMLLTAKNYGGISDVTQHAAVGLELLHTASLVHDDVVDESSERRGRPSINRLYDNKIAVLVGDFILALSLQNVSKVNSPRLMGVVAQTSQKLASGELLQLKSVHNQEISEEVYFRIIKEKTAVLFSACAQAGALSVSSDEMAIEILKKFGEIVGVCFQIRDDIFDYSDSRSIGKPTGNDMQEGKLTLPVIYVLQSTGDEEMLRIAKAVKNFEATEAEIAQLIAFAVAHGGIEYANKKMYEYAEKAKSLLDSFSDSEVKQALLQYVDFVVDRTV